MLLITQNYLLHTPDLFQCKEAADTNATIEELKRSLAARVRKLDPTALKDTK